MEMIQFKIQQQITFYCNLFSYIVFFEIWLSQNII